MKSQTTAAPGRAAPAPIASFSTLTTHPRITGELVERGGEAWYEITGLESMAPFLMTLASDSDHWLFLLSNGGLTAGRRDPDLALFPYYTQDKLLDMSGRSGSRTLVRTGGRVWEPLAPWERDNGIRQRVRKNALGSCIELEEENGHGLVYRLSWRACERFGFVRRVELGNRGGEAADLDVLDGLLNVMPHGLSQRFQNEFSILGDAYKQAELVPPGDLAIYHLSSVPTDLAEPMEALRATVVWQCGSGVVSRHLTADVIEPFLRGGELPEAEAVRGRRGAYLVRRRLVLAPGATAVWHTCADVGRDLRQVEELRALLDGGESIADLIEEDCRGTETRLRAMLAAADGIQCTAEKGRCLRHTSNTLFNLMRGGAFPTGYALPADDVLHTVAGFNREAAAKLRQVFKATPGALSCSDPWNPDHPVGKCGRDAVRLLREYLPLSFSRRHGDPSRPWNRFSIDIRKPDGSPRFAYQGNWRDIFQNWEALLQAWPEYSEAAICRFLNASTADGYNPYRVTKAGFEWERLEPGDTWANIGYWGDHQIIYLLRLLETSVRFHPETLHRLLGEEAFVYAEIPYRLRSFDETLANPRATVDFDHEWEHRILERVAAIGADGKLMHNREGALHYVSLLEKLLAPLLAKLSNFIPGGGIWMNTQRPEWNDANNALVGYGVSVVTLGYIARYLRFLLGEFGGSLRDGRFQLSCELADLLKEQLSVFAARPSTLSDSERLGVMQQLGRQASAYRALLYAGGLCGRKDPVDGARIVAYLEGALRHVDACLRENQRADGLWHSYNLLDPAPGRAGIKRLFVMLEGQVSILSSGLLGVGEILQLLASLRASDLYRSDQDSYLLYPDRDMPGFLGKNRLPRARAEKIPALRRMLREGDARIIVPLPSGDVAFNGDFHNASDLQRHLGAAGPESAADAPAILKLFEEAFNHHAFTGRSGTFFAYEGLGSIYWHMVSKLALAVQENYLALRDSCEPRQAAELLQRFREIRDGLGVNKNPALYGAFPTDAYSHTPAHAGAQQPGMTGQVKEDILIRLNELGVRIRNGCLSFDASMVEPGEFTTEATSLRLPGPDGAWTEIALPRGALAFSFCGIPVVYNTAPAAQAMRVIHADGRVDNFQLPELNLELSREIFARTGAIRRIEVACRRAG